MAVLIFVLSLPFAALADERVPLSEDPELEYGLRLVAKGHFMRKNCKEISPRRLRSYGLLHSMINRGRELGYSDDEMRAYVENKDQKNRVRGLARAELERKGVDFDDPDSFCVLARSEIAADRDFGHYFTIR